MEVWKTGSALTNIFQPSTVIGHRSSVIGQLSTANRQPPTVNKKRTSKRGPFLLILKNYHTRLASSLPALNFATFFAFILMVAPV